MALFADSSLYRHKKAGYSRFCRDTQTLYDQIMDNTASDVHITNFIRLVEAEDRLFRIVRLIMLDFSRPASMPPHPLAGMERIRYHFRDRLLRLNDTYRDICPTSFHRRDRILVRNALLEHWKRERAARGDSAMTPEEERLRILSLNILTNIPVETDTEAPRDATPAQVWESLVDHVRADPYLNIGFRTADGNIQQL